MILFQKREKIPCLSRPSHSRSDLQQRDTELRSLPSSSHSQISHATQFHESPHIYQSTADMSTNNNISSQVIKSQPGLQNSDLVTSDNCDQCDRDSLSFANTSLEELESASQTGWTLESCGSCQKMGSCHSSHVKSCLSSPTLRPYSTEFHSTPYQDYLTSPKSQHVVGFGGQIILNNTNIVICDPQRSASVMPHQLSVDVTTNTVLHQDTSNVRGNYTTRV